MQEYLGYSDDDILERVDEYSLYCHYLKFEPYIGKKYSSPIRLGDADPSFAIFERKYTFGGGNLPTEYLWKDQAISSHGPKDIFDLVEHLFDNVNTRTQAYWKVCGDFGLGGADKMDDGLLIFKEPKFMEPINIKVLSKPFSKRDLLYWQQYNVSETILAEYNVRAIDCYWLTATQQYPSYPKGLGYSYRIYDKYQIYFPFQDKKKKFRNNWIDSCISGLQQLKGNDTLIITKAYKDVMCLRSLGYDAIAPRGENIMLPELCVSHMVNRYKNIVTLFDNDEKHKAAKYPFKMLQVPLESGQKDITDYCAVYGVEQTVKLIKELLWQT
jgi:hypothetical protein